MICRHKVAFAGVEITLQKAGKKATADNAFFSLKTKGKKNPKILYFAFLSSHGKKNVWDRITAAHPSPWKAQKRALEREEWDGSARCLLLAVF